MKQKTGIIAFLLGGLLIGCPIYAAEQVSDRLEEVQVSLTQAEEGQGSETYAEEAQGSMNYAEEAQGSMTYAEEAQGSETYAEEAQGSETYAEEAQGSETYVEEAQGSETYAEEAQGSETYAEEAQGSETYAEEAQGSMTYAEEAQGSETYAEESQGSLTQPEESLQENQLRSEEVWISPSVSEEYVEEPAGENQPRPIVEGIAIDEVHFPDNLFRKYIVENCDRNKDDLLAPEEIRRTVKIVLKEKRMGFVSLKGIEYFTSLTELHFEGRLGTLSELDVSQNTALRTLYLQGAGLVKLDLSQNQHLKSLACMKMPGELAAGLNISSNEKLESLNFHVVNPVKTLDLTNNTALKALSVKLEINEKATNNFDSLNISRNTKLQNLYICILTGGEITASDIKFRSLVLDYNQKLKRIELRGLPVIALDLRHNLLLEELICRDSKITELNLSRNRELRSLDCRDNGLKELNLSNNLYLEKLICGGNHIGWLDISANKKLKLFLPDERRTVTGFLIGENNRVYLKEAHLDITNYPELEQKGIFGLENMKLEGETLIIEDSAKEASYQYDCGNGRSMKVVVVIDADEYTTTNYKIVFVGNGADSGEMEPLAGCERDLGYAFPVNTLRREGYSFVGWNTRADGTGITYHDQAVVRNLAAENETEVYVYAQWEKDVVVETEISEKEFIFTDVEKIPGNWKYESVSYVYNRGFMGVIGGTQEFRPDQPVTRTMFATILYRIAGSPKVSFRNRFTDVQRGKWYSDGVYWVSNRGICSGYSDGSFGLHKNITREQMAKMLFLFAKTQGYDVSQRASLDSFSDGESVNHWATSSMQWAVEMGIISGKPNEDGTSRLAPQSEVSRVECARMLMMFSVAFLHK